MISPQTSVAHKSHPLDLLARASAEGDIVDTVASAAGRSESRTSTRGAMKLNGPLLAHPQIRILRQCYEASSGCDQISTAEKRQPGILSVAVPYLWVAPVSREK